jgi:hypothetical protein
VLFMSGSAEEHIKAPWAAARNGAHFIAKPLLLKDLVQRVNANRQNEDVCTVFDEPELTYA